MNSASIKKMIPETVLHHFLKNKSLPDFDTDLCVRAIDVGYGYTKFIKNISPTGEIETGIFPSMAVLSPMEDLSGDFFVQRDTIKIDSGGTIWEVGPDIFDLASKNEVRALHENYIASEQWKVLFLGALAYMDCDVIDVLVLGLPVSHMKNKDHLCKIATGKHTVGNREFMVKQVMVIPQPLGSLYSHIVQSDNFDHILNTNTLVVDPGYLTFDFLVTKGISVNAVRSGARPGGMNAVLSTIASSISAELNITYDDLNEVDQALNLKGYSGTQKNRPIRVYGNEVNLSAHIAKTKPVIETSMNFMINRIGDTKDISQIIMTGGPNVIFEKAIKAQFPMNSIHTTSNGIFANVTGYLFYGLMVAYGILIQTMMESAKKK